MVALLFSASMTCSPTWMPSPVPAVANSPPLLVITVPLLTVRVPMVSCAKAGKARAAVAASTTLASVFMRFILNLGGKFVTGFTNLLAKNTPTVGGLQGREAPAGAGVQATITARVPEAA